MTDSRVIAITGISRGLGRALACRLAAAGHRVFGCARSADATAEVDAVLAKAGGGAEVVDVTDPGAVEAWAGDVIGAAGAPDLLVNNAALINANAPVWRVPPDEFAAVTAVNINGVHHVLRAFVPPMIDAGRGVIVNVSSTWGRSAAGEVGPYCATKFAVEGLTSSLSQELPPGLAAVSLNPGVIHTEMLESCFGSSASSYEGPEAWAERAAPFLLGLGPDDNGRAATAP